ncbi:thioredoxin-disulfide reductase [Candidatus Azobacteroides pseudotrichonymphae]|uniref:Thioredoxin reductase n=1 Tax=Azobacteroides pseudotrichonymphae genomovar. CFP2 TaxID=511995 RepID=B6YR80_AZOPC|nr:thioredoxin-disulfide reductase [Candidatus Azobacteroides pseudotrichonymphae]BAG83702.1 NADP-dependent thioredoxin reductase [Candidatus Azobacteroides pseudotrichonymphae genomovar. CFP2]
MKHNTNNKSSLQDEEQVKCLIIGSGPAGYSSAIYTARASLSPILYEGTQSGGQLTTTFEIENFPGYPDAITGIKMMENFKKQAQKFGTDVRKGTVTACDLSRQPYKVVIDNKQTIETDTLVICTGATAKYLGLSDEQKYIGRGVSACAVCDGFFYRKKIVAIVGGGDSACEEALYLASIANKVYLIVRKNHLRASQIMQTRVLSNTKIEVYFNTNVIGLFGEEFVEGIHLIKYRGEANEEKIDMTIDGFFLAIGRKPNSEIFRTYISTDSNGYIKTQHGTTKTNLPGVFAAGDVSDPNYQQAITAAGAGCMAAIEVERYLNEMKH